MSQDGPSSGDQLFLARPFVLLTRLIIAFPATTLALMLGLAVGACYLTATRLGYQTSRMDLLDPKSNYNQLWTEYIDEFGDEDDAVVVVEGNGREQVVPVLEELSAALARRAPVSCRAARSGPGENPLQGAALSLARGTRRHRALSGRTGTHPLGRLVVAQRQPHGRRPAAAIASRRWRPARSGRNAQKVARLADSLGAALGSADAINPPGRRCPRRSPS